MELWNYIHSAQSVRGDVIPEGKGEIIRGIHRAIVHRVMYGMC